MLNPTEREYEDFFFDSVERLSSGEESVSSEEDGFLGYELWRNEPRSSKERRDVFLRRMGLVDFASRDEPDVVDLIEMGVDRVTEGSGAVSTIDDDVEEDDQVFSCREESGEANLMVDDLDHDQSSTESVACTGDTHISSDKKKVRHWWRQIMRNRRKLIEKCKHEATKKDDHLKVHVRKKMFKEMTAVYVGQEIRAHKGIIWTMKFSPDGQFLASGGEDRVVRIWCITSSTSNRMSFGDDHSSDGSREQDRETVHVVIPDEVFQIEELPFQEFHGHNGDVLDLAWSNTNYLLSSSMDGTVRMWQVESDECLHVFHHTNYVTCVQFCPSNDSYFISGSIDGKVRIWSVLERRVVDWFDVRDVVSSICYQPDAKGFVVGCLAGGCRFYEAAGCSFELIAKLQIHGSKRLFGNRITCIQFCKEYPHRIMVTTEGSKLHVFDRTDIVLKYRGLTSSGCQMSASFTANGRHIISVGEDSRVYIWNYEPQHVRLPGCTKSIRSCEYFHSEGVSTAVPWSGRQAACDSSYLSSTHPEAQRQLSPDFRSKKSKPSTLVKWLSRRSSFRDSATTWPEETLSPVASSPDHGQPPDHKNHEVLSSLWGLVIVAASWDGAIRAIHNYGLPFRI